MATAIAPPKQHDKALGSAISAAHLSTLPVGDDRVEAEYCDDKDDTGGSSTDRLPVVEIRPFVRREWHPACSRSEYYDRVSTVMTDRSCSRDSSNGYPDAAQLGIPTTSRSADCRSRRSSSGDRKDQARPRPKEGKSIETTHPGMFITPNDREKTTMRDVQGNGISNGGPSTQNASIKRSLTENQLARQREMRVRGQGIDDLPPKLSMIYMAPWEYYRMNSSYPLLMTNQSNFENAIENVEFAQQKLGHAQQTTVFIDGSKCRYQAVENVYIDDIYDAFDRANTLPSIQVTNTKLQKRPRKKVGLPPRSSNLSVSAPGSSTSPIYRLGVANSLDVLRHFGKPAHVENHLSMHQRQTLSQLRRSHDSQSTLQGLALGNPLHPIPIWKPQGMRINTNPTYGETMIRAGLEANHKKNLIRNIRAALPSKSAPDVLSRPITRAKSDASRLLADGNIEDNLHTTNDNRSRSRSKASLRQEFPPPKQSPFADPSLKPENFQNPSNEVTLSRQSYQETNDYHDNACERNTSYNSGLQKPILRKRINTDMKGTELEQRHDNITVEKQSQNVTPRSMIDSHDIIFTDPPEDGSYGQNIIGNTIDGLDEGTLDEHSSKTTSYQDNDSHLNNRLEEQWRMEGEKIVKIPRASVASSPLERTTEGSRNSTSIADCIDDITNNNATNDTEEINRMENNTSGLTTDNVIFEENLTKLDNENKTAGCNEDISIITLANGNAKDLCINLKTGETNSEKEGYVDNADIVLSCDAGAFAEAAYEKGNNTLPDKMVGQDIVMTGSHNYPDELVDSDHMNSEDSNKVKINDEISEVSRTNVTPYSFNEPDEQQREQYVDTGHDVIEASRDVIDIQSKDIGTKDALEEGVGDRGKYDVGNVVGDSSGNTIDAATECPQAIDQTSEEERKPSEQEAAFNCESTITQTNSLKTPPSHPQDGDKISNQRVLAKSAASKASSATYQGEAIYLTNWDQKTDSESLRTDTVLSIREEPELKS